MTTRKLVCAAWLMTALAVAQPPAKKRDPLPPKVVAAWKAAGVHIVDKPMDVYPWFYIRSKAATGWDKLPSPTQPFSVDMNISNLQGLSAHSKLLTLTLFNCRGTDAAMKEVARMKGLHNLNLIGSDVTEAGLKEVAGLDGLRYLNLSSTPVNDRGLRHLARLSGLSILNLSNTQVTDEGLTALVGLPRLEYLNLTETAVTDAGLESVAAFKSLRHVAFHSKGVTAAGLAKLRRERPRLEVSHNDARLISIAPVRFRAPRDGDVLDSSGDLQFEVEEVPGATHYSWLFYQNGKMVVNGYVLERKSLGHTYRLKVGSPGWKALKDGAVEVECSAFVDKGRTKASTLRVTLKRKR